MDDWGFIEHFGAWITVAGGVFALFIGVGSSVTTDLKQDAVKWIKSRTPKKATLSEKSPDPYKIFSQVFDRIYTKNHLSWKCFLRSSITSLLVVLLLHFIIFGYSVVLLMNILPLMILMALVGNVIPDYISLFETRLILKYIENKNPIVIIGLLILDFVLTFITSMLIILIFYLLQIFNFTVNVNVNVVDFIEIVIHYLISPIKYPGTLEGFMSPLVYSNFFTSVWLWLFVISGSLLKLIGLSKRGIFFLTQGLDIENKPFHVLGLMAAFIVSVVYILLAI